MNHPLDGARLKVVRAQEHLDTLKSEIGDYVDGTPKPYSVILKQKAEGVAAERLKELRPDVVSWWLIDFDIHRPPPLRLSGIVGDCISNLRSVLDYITWSLASRYCPRPLQPPPHGKDKIYFPIYDVAGDKRLADALDGLAKYSIPATAIDEIKNVQPYNAGYEPIALLHALVNIDKHRLPLLTVTVFDHTNVMELTNTGFTCIGNAPIWVPSFSAEHPFAGSHVKVYPDAATLVTWQDVTMPREPVDSTLEKFVKSVANVIPRFDSFF